MKKIFKNTFLTTCKIMGFFRLFRKLNSRKLVVLTYHGIGTSPKNDVNDFEYRNCVSTEQFEKQIDYMLHYYKPLHGDDWLQQGSKHLFNDRHFLLTFDDGFLNNYTLAYPILCKKSVTAIFFVTTGFIGKRQLLWTEKIIYLLMNTTSSTVTVTLGFPTTLGLETFVEKESACQKVRKNLKQSTKAEIECVLNELAQQITDVSLENVPMGRYAFMNWNHLEEMAKKHMIIGSHTENHMLLSNLSLSEVERELTISKVKIEQALGKECLLFSYPNGTKNDFTEEHKRILKNSGYKYVFSQIPGFNTESTDLFEIRRLNITNKMDLTTFEATVSGFLPSLKKKLSRWRQ